MGRTTSPQRSRGAGWRREGDPEKYLGTLRGLRYVALQGSHQIRNFGVKAQLDSVMTLWGLKIFELEMRRQVIKRLVGKPRILARGIDTSCMT